MSHPLEKEEGDTLLSADWNKIFTLVLTPEMYGAIGSPLANDTVAFQNLTAAVTANNGATIEFFPGKIYYVGAQNFAPAAVTGRWVKYTGIPELIMEFEDVTGNIHIKGNGATIKIVDGLKHGTFTEEGVATSHTLPYYGEEITVAYTSIITVINCSGLFIVENLELDGNSPNVVLGGGWGDTGYQLGGNGISMYNHTGGGYIRGVNSHHHLADGIVINGVATSEAAGTELFEVSLCHFDYNARLGIAFVGGRGFYFHTGTSNFNGNQAAIGSAFASSPASGVDFEAEGGDLVRDVSFFKWDFIGNNNTQMVADSGTPVDRIRFEQCRFVATTGITYCIWPNRPGIVFDDCLIAGTVVNCWINPLNPHETVQFNDCIFTNSDEFSPTGTTVTINNLLFDSPGDGLTLRRCRLDFNKSGASSNFNVDGPVLEDCTITARAGFPAVGSRLTGKSEWIETGTASIQGTPGGSANPAFPFKVNSGHAEGVWAYTTGGVRTEYPATWNPITNTAI